MVLMQEDLLHCGGFSLLSSTALCFFSLLNYSAHSSWHSHGMVVLTDLVKSFGGIFFTLAYTYLIVFTADTHSHAGTWTRAIFVLNGVCCDGFWTAAYR